MDDLKKSTYWFQLTSNITQLITIILKKQKKKLTCNIMTLEKLDPSLCLSPLLHPPQNAKKGWVHVCPRAVYFNWEPCYPFAFFQEPSIYWGEEAFRFTHAGAKLQAVPPGRGGVGARTCNVRFQRDRKSKLLNTGALKHGIRNPESRIWNPETESRKWKQKPKQNTEYVKEGSKWSVWQKILAMTTQ